MSRGRSESAAGRDGVRVCVEMEERDTAWQEPGYDGLCNYAQKITSQCFGLDGKRNSRI